MKAGTGYPLASPLFMVMDDPILHQFITYLAVKKSEQEAEPEVATRIELSSEFITSVRESFQKHILDGERHLHVLAHLLASVFLKGDFELYSNVIGLLPDDDERPFLLRERITRETLFSVTDIDLGRTVLDNFRYQQDGRWVPLMLSANFVEYIPVASPPSGVNRLTSRVKAEEELVNKLADELFSIDELVNRDKQLRKYSKFIKDVFGIKIVCEDEATCWQIDEELHKLTVSNSRDEFVEDLETRTEEVALDDPECPLLAFIESKDYLSPDAERLKRSGWRAIKSVVNWHDRLFEIQIQPLTNYYLELDHMAGPSHRSHKRRRDSVRDEIAERIPLYGFYRDLLKMIFVGTPRSFEYGRASVVIN